MTKNKVIIKLMKRISIKLIANIKLKLGSRVEKLKLTLAH